jgi:glycerophosphoryl diester phosphodiesterase
MILVSGEDKMTMKILAHRGHPNNDNSFNSLTNSLSMGFGIETDIRDLNNSLVIAHDPPMVENQYDLIEKLFAYYKNNNLVSPLALNIKSSGIDKLLLPLIEEYEILNYFCFDLPIPEILNYKNKINFFIRFSEYERINNLINYASGIWVDFFDSNNLDQEKLDYLANSAKLLAFVSPELHGKKINSFWEKIIDFSEQHNQLNVLICTDFPEKLKKLYE